MARKALSLDYLTALAAPVAAQRNVPVAVVLAIAAKESGFCGWATRGEPQIGDASIGLMQVLLSTARSLGYDGEVGYWDDASNTGTGLYDAGTNLFYGIAFFADLLDQTGGDVERAISAYNAGLGNAHRYTQVTRFCLAWKPTAPKTGRNLDRDCANIYTAQPGEFGNQPYVTSVLKLAQSYGFVASDGGGAIPGGVEAPGTPSDSTSPAGSTTFFVVSTVVLIVAAAVVGVVWMAQQARHG